MFLAVLGFGQLTPNMVNADAYPQGIPEASFSSGCVATDWQIVNTGGQGLRVGNGEYFVGLLPGDSAIIPVGINQVFIVGDLNQQVGSPTRPDCAPIVTTTTTTTVPPSDYPPRPGPTPTPTPAPPPAAGPSLPATGSSELTPMVGRGALLLGMGSLLLAVARRRAHA